MSHPASTVRQQVSQLWEKIVVKRSSSGAALQHNVVQSIMSVVARYGIADATLAGTSSSKNEGDWAAMEAALMSLELVLRIILTPASPSVAASAAPPAISTPGLTPSSGNRTVGSGGNSASSGIGSGSIPSFQSQHTPLHTAAAAHHLATPSSPADRSPKPSPMHGRSRRCFRARAAPSHRPETNAHVQLGRFGLLLLSMLLPAQAAFCRHQEVVI